MGNRLGKALIFTLLMNCAVTAHSEDKPDWSAETLSGDWGGVRASLYNKGINVDIAHKSDLLANIAGGIRRGSAWLANTEVAIGVDLEQYAGLDGTTVFLQYHAQHGNQSKDFNGSYVGSFAGVSNIETGTTTGQFYQAWLEKSSADNSLALLVGLYAIDSDFYVTDTSGLCHQPPYGMSAEMAQTGQNGPPIFPMGALGMRVKYAAPNFYIQGAMTDGVPGDPDKAYGTHVLLTKTDGTLTVVEMGYMPSVDSEAVSKTAVGIWSYSVAADDLTEVDTLGNPLRREDRGVYILAEHTLIANQDGAGSGLSGFVRLGTVNKDVYQADWSVSLGLHYQGMPDGRDDDEIGIAATTSHASDKYRQLYASDSFETVFEITYRAQLKPWLAVQESLQRIINPNMDKALRDASVVSIRIELAI